ncbi:MAG TPA: SAM-dependent chlorinase/fluorinase [Bacteroidia bacterium]|nr:SAM-dependent chlorinase/fluorinase [Bacteroidia bacterium]
MSVITLTTDFGLKDHYASSLRGALMRNAPAVTVAEITHLIAPFNIGEAAFILDRAFRDFPEGSVHVVAVGSGGGRFGQIAVSIQKHFFIGCDNGLFSLIGDEPPGEVVQLAVRGEEPSTFLARDLYIPAAIKLVDGALLKDLGPPLNAFTQRQRQVAPPEADMLKGTILYVDSFGNLITDIRREDFHRVGRGRSFTIELVGEQITSLHRNYGDVPEGEIVAFFNSSSVLEIAINNGHGSGLLNLNVHTVVRIMFG